MFDDGHYDKLTGNAGHDWFIFNSEEDEATDLDDDELADLIDLLFGGSG